MNTTLGKNENAKESPLTHALDTLGRMVYVGSVERGLSCNCRCPKCNEPLVAKLGHEGGRQPHFAHRKGSDCHGYYMSALHKMAEQIIEEEMAVMVPAYKEIDKQKLEFVKIEVEQRVERKDLQPDIVGVTSNGLRWFVEIRNTHEVDEAKMAKLIESNITCLEIDVREQTLEGLKKFLLESIECREWINNPNYDSQIAEAKRERVSQIEKLLLESKELTIPIYADADTQIINFKEVTTLSRTGDGLYVRIKVISSDDIPYVFEICSNDIIETTNGSLGHDCNELKILTDNLPLNSVLTLSDLDIKWTYHYATEKEREARINDYKSNPQYEVRPEADCYSNCKYRPYLGKCIYSKSIFSQNGVDYVVCNKGKRQKDEAVAPSQNQISNTRLSIDIRFQRLDNWLQRNNIKDGNYTKITQNKSKCEEPVVQPQNKPSPDTLPFERFWTTEEFYTQLQSTSSYETEKGILAEIVKCDRTKRGILLLYRDPCEVRTYCPFHIAIVYVSNGNLNRNKVADFTNRKAALNSYYTRLRNTRDSFLIQSEEAVENELPF